MRAMLIILVLAALGNATVEAAREIEPNNHWLQATLIDGTEPVYGALDDEQDVYKLLLPETGEVTVTLDKFPDGANLTLEVLGFRKDPIVPINRVRTRDAAQLKAVFYAQERIGHLVVNLDPAEKVCKDQWCIMRLVSGGPYYLLQSGPTLPPSWNDQPILEPPDYRLTIVHPEIVRQKQAEEAARRAVANLPLFSESRYGLNFRYPPDWQAKAVSARRIEIEPERRKGEQVQVVIGIRDKANFPGSSADLQLNLAEKTLVDANARIAKRGVLTVMQRQVPYLLGSYPDAAAEAELAHLQLVLDHAEQYVWISYSAPAETYADFTSGFATILKTLEIHPPPVNEPAP